MTSYNDRFNKIIGLLHEEEEQMDLWKKQKEKCEKNPAMYWCDKSKKCKFKDTGGVDHPHESVAHTLDEDIDWEEQDRLKQELLNDLQRTDLRVENIPNSNKISINGIQVTVDGRVR